MGVKRPREWERTLAYYWFISVEGGTIFRPDGATGTCSLFLCNEINVCNSVSSLICYNGIASICKCPTMPYYYETTISRNFYTYRNKNKTRRHCTCLLLMRSSGQQIPSPLIHIMQLHLIVSVSASTCIMSYRGNHISKPVPVDFVSPACPHVGFSYIL